MFGLYATRRSSDYKDELVWAAVWLYKATGNRDYLEYAEKNYREGPAWAFCWDEKWAGAQVGLPLNNTIICGQKEI